MGIACLSVCPTLKQKVQINQSLFEWVGVTGVPAAFSLKGRTLRDRTLLVTQRSRQVHIARWMAAYTRSLV